MLRHLLFVLLTILSPSRVSAQEANQDVFSDWSPVTAEGWPKNQTLESLRTLPSCAPGQAHPAPGEPITCRPTVQPATPPWFMNLAWRSGPVVGEDRALALHAFGIELGVGLTRHVSLGLVYQLGPVAVQAEAEETASRLGQDLLGQLQMRVFTDEVDRDAWALGLAGGVLVRDELLGGHAPALRFALSREVGMYLDWETALVAALELAYTEGLGSQWRSLTLGGKIGFEDNIILPSNLGTEDAPAARQRAGAELMVAPSLGFAVTRAWSLARPVEVTGSVGVTVGFDYDGGRYSFEGSQWSAQAGLRLSALLPRRAPLYLLLQAGPAWIARADDPLTVLTDAEVGFELEDNCSIRLDVGVRLRSEYDDMLAPFTGSLVFRGSSGSPYGRSCGTVQMQPMMMVEPAPRELAPPEPPTRKADVIPAPPSSRGEAEVETDPRTGAGAETGAPPEPVVVEIVLGWVGLGGLVEVRIDPSLIPWRQLERAGSVQVQLLGPPRALARFEAELRATFDARGFEAPHVQPAVGIGNHGSGTLRDLATGNRTTKIGRFRLPASPVAAKRRFVPGWDCPRVLRGSGEPASCGVASRPGPGPRLPACCRPCAPDCWWPGWDRVDRGVTEDPLQEELRPAVHAVVRSPVRQRLAHRALEHRPAIEGLHDEHSDAMGLCRRQQALLGEPVDHAVRKLHEVDLLPGDHGARDRRRRSAGSE